MRDPAKPEFPDLGLLYPEPLKGWFQINRFLNRVAIGGARLERPHKGISDDAALLLGRQPREVLLQKPRKALRHVSGRRSNLLERGGSGQDMLCIDRCDSMGVARA